MSTRLLDLINEVADEHVEAVADLLEEEFGLETAERRKLRQMWEQRLTEALRTPEGLMALKQEMLAGGLSEQEFITFIAGYIGRA